MGANAARLSRGHPSHCKNCGSGLRDVDSSCRVPVGRLNALRLVHRAKTVRVIEDPLGPSLALASATMNLLPEEWQFSMRRSRILRGRPD